MKHIRFDASLLTANQDNKKPRRLSLLAYSGGTMPIGGRMVLIDLAGLALPDSVPILADHANELGAVVGSGEPTISAGKLYVSCTMADSEAAEQVLALMESGVSLQASVGAEILESRPLRAGETVEVNGQTHSIEQPVTLVTSGRLREVSIVPIGADAESSASLAAHFGSSVSQIRARAAEAATERARISAIQDIAAQWRSTAPQVDDLAARAIGNGDSAELFEAKVTSATRNRFMINPHHRTQPATGDVLAASLALQGGVSADFLKTSGTDPRVLDAAMGARNRDVTLHGILRHVLAAAGQHVPTGKLSVDDIRAAFRASDMLCASGGTSTYSLPGILSSSLNKILLQSYESVPSVWRSFSRRGSIDDFKPSKRYRLLASGQFEPIAPGGQVKHVSLRESAYTAQLSTEGAVIALDRRDLVNDDLGSFMQLPRLLGRQAAVAVERAVFAMLLANEGDFFHGDNGNLITGTESALSDAGLTGAYTKFLEARDGNGNPALITPKVLLVPPALFAQGRKLLTSQGIVIAGDSDALVPDGNPWANMFDLQVSPYLAESSGLEGADDASWYLLAAGTDFAAVAVDFLQGRETPTIEEGTLDFDRLGLSLRAYHDFGVSFLEQHGGVLAVGS